LLYFIGYSKNKLNKNKQNYIFVPVS